MRPQASLITVLASSLLVPFFARRFGITLTEDDVSALVGLSLAVAHAVQPRVSLLLDKYLPAPAQEAHHE